MIGSFKALASIVGLPVRCMKCRQFGHIKNHCTAERCKRCKAFTHPTEKCSMAAAISGREQKKKLAENNELDDEILKDEEKKVTQQSAEHVPNFESLGSVSRFDKREKGSKRPGDDDISPQKEKGQRPADGNTSSEGNGNNDNGEDDEMTTYLLEQDSFEKQRQDAWKSLSNNKINNSTNRNNKSSSNSSSNRNSHYDNSKSNSSRSNRRSNLSQPCIHF